MSVPASPTPGNRPRPTPADPIQMSLAEKLACEREARHDVAARGRIADIAPVQHYLEHARCEDHRHPAAGRERRTGHTPQARPPATGLSGWLRWGEDAPASDSPHFPPV